MTESEFVRQLGPEERQAYYRLSADERRQVIASSNGQGQVDVAAKPQVGLGQLQQSLNAAITGGTAAHFAGGGAASAAPAAPTLIGATNLSSGAIGTPAAAAPGMGAGLAAAGAIGAGVYLNNIYEGGGKDIIRGKGKGEDYANLALDINPVTAPINFLGRQFGMPSVGRALFGGSRTKGEEDKRKQLIESGVEIPNSDVKEWENNEGFRNSRQESDLTGKDIIHSADFYGIEGFAGLDAAKQEAIAGEALKQNLIQEKLGKINLSMTPEYQKYLDEQIGTPDGNIPDSNSNSGDNRRFQAEAKKDRKKKALADIMPTIQADYTQAPRYDLNPGTLIKNPYL